MKRALVAFFFLFLSTSLFAQQEAVLDWTADRNSAQVILFDALRDYAQYLWGSPRPEERPLRNLLREVGSNVTLTDGHNILTCEATFFPGQSFNSYRSVLRLVGNTGVWQRDLSFQGVLYRALRRYNVNHGNSSLRVEEDGTILLRDPQSTSFVINRASSSQTPPAYRLEFSHPIAPPPPPPVGEIFLPKEFDLLLDEKAREALAREANDGPFSLAKYTYRQAGIVEFLFISKKPWPYRTVKRGIVLGVLKRGEEVVSATAASTTVPVGQPEFVVDPHASLLFTDPGFENALSEAKRAYGPMTGALVFSHVEKWHPWSPDPNAVTTVLTVSLEPRASMVPPTFPQSKIQIRTEFNDVGNSIRVVRVSWTIRGTRSEGLSLRDSISGLQRKMRGDEAWQKNDGEDVAREIASRYTQSVAEARQSGTTFALEDVFRNTVGDDFVIDQLFHDRDFFDKLRRLSGTELTTANVRELILKHLKER